MLQAEAQLFCSCGIWGLGVNDRLKWWVYFSWALFQKEFAFNEITQSSNSKLIVSGLLLGRGIAQQLSRQLFITKARI